MYNIWLDFCGIIIMTILLFTFYIKYNVPVQQYQFFKILMCAVLVSTSSDLLAGIWGNHVELAVQIFTPMSSKIIHVIYFFSRNMTPVAFFLYLMSVMNLRKKSNKEKLVLLPIVFLQFMVVLSPVTGFIFHIDERGNYHRGSLITVAYVVAAGYMLLSLVLIVAYRKNLSLYQYAAFLGFEIIAMASVMIQGAYPHFLVENFGSAICILMIYLSIQKPEEILDGATGFLNKKAFSNIMGIRLKQKILQTLYVLNLQDYELLEKSYGLDAMEKLMGHIASYLKSYSGMTAYRIGEDNICLVADGEKRKGLETAAEQIHKRFLEPWKVLEYNVALSVNSGIIRCPEDAADFQEVMELISTMANLAKEENRIIRIGEMDLSKIRRKYLLETIVLEAVERDILEVVYQPIYSPKSSRFLSAEALLRMKDDVLGNVSPAEFIPIAEKNGAIVKIGNYVMDTVCRFIAENELEKYGLEYIEVNISPVECLQEDMEESIIGKITEYGLRPERINLEITETAISFLPESVDKKMQQLLAAGVSFSLDDYGTGYSNLSRLAALPLEIIKIDKSIVQEAFTSDTMKVVLDNTLRMVNMMNRRILAEGVEERQQADYLIEHGCDYIQGYYYAKPLSADAFVEFIKKQNHL